MFLSHSSEKEVEKKNEKKESEEGIGQTIGSVMEKNELKWFKSLYNSVISWNYIINVISLVIVCMVLTLPHTTFLMRFRLQAS